MLTILLAVIVHRPASRNRHQQAKKLVSRLRVTVARAPRGEPVMTISLALTHLKPVCFPGIKQAKKLGFRLRVMVARAPWGEPVVTKMVAGIGRLSAPINGSNTIPISFDAVLEQWGIVTVEGKRKVTDTISNEAGRVMKVGWVTFAVWLIKEVGAANVVWNKPQLGFEAEQKSRSPICEVKPAQKSWRKEPEELMGYEL